ncbi:MAG: hypothetical protein AMQ22_00029 [Candidatus Methanofastidiosum methylothiophilum]|uniref:Uncharacterized protein n=1 Tax=Candidatus Methanofastidiosum methylothiophilum TaxID=1705564 RepID=A0A150J9F2_9EURY|nr:MAG: hypothetical protein AMQ22_00029 [Candidatus Methanofastidiosum methylthiophilus]
MAMVDEYYFLEVEGSRTDFLRELNKKALDGYRPIWKTLDENRILPNEFSCYMFRKISTTPQNNLEIKTICNEEGINNFPLYMGEL